MMNRVTRMLKIRFPVIQAGMIWCSGWELASAVSNAGGLGVIGSGSMSPGVMQDHIRKCRAATGNTFGVNIPLLYSGNEEKFRIIFGEKVPVVITSAGNPAKYTSFLKENGIIVLHVAGSLRSAMKCEEAGVDAIIAEGFEAGGHNAREETTTMVLVPMIREKTSVPLIAAGGISSGRSMLAAFALGAEGVQVGSRFVASTESSAHPDFKKRIIEAHEGDTMLSLKKIVPVRILKNNFYRQVEAMEGKGAGPEELAALLGKGRARKGMFEGDLDEGELEIGQVSGMIHDIRPAAEIMEEMMKEFNEIRDLIAGITFDNR